MNAAAVAWDSIVSALDAVDMEVGGLPESGVMRRAKPVAGPRVELSQDGEGFIEVYDTSDLVESAAVYDRARSSALYGAERARDLLGVSACVDETGELPRMEPFDYRGARIVRHDVGRSTGEAFVFAGEHPPSGAEHADALARRLGYVDRFGLNPDYRKLYAFARAGLAVAFVKLANRARFYLVRDEERLRAADAIRRLGGRLPKGFGRA